MTHAESLSTRIEREIRRQAELDVIVEETDGALMLSGMVDSSEDRDAALDIARDFAGSLRVEDNLEIERAVADGSGAPDQDRFGGAAAGAANPDDFADDLGGALEPDFAAAPVMSDPVAAPGPGSDIDDAVQEGETYAPPTDPVITTDVHGDVQVLGGFSSDSMEELHVDPSSSDDRLGDGAIEEAIQRELREDAATTDLRIHVIVRNGIVHLRGTVAGAEDAEAAEEVASRVPGVLEVREELEVATL